MKHKVINKLKKIMAENFTSEMFDGSKPDLESTEKNIFFSRPTTVFAAVAASIFTVIGVLGKNKILEQKVTKVAQNFFDIMWRRL